MLLLDENSAIFKTLNIDLVGVFGQPYVLTWLRV